MEGVTIAANRQSPPRRWHLPVTRLRSASPGGMEPNCKANRNKKRKSQGNQSKQGVKISCRTAASALVVVLVCISHDIRQSSHLQGAAFWAMSGLRTLLPLSWRGDSDCPSQQIWMPQLKVEVAPAMEPLLTRVAGEDSAKFTIDGLRF